MGILTLSALLNTLKIPVNGYKLTTQIRDLLGAEHLIVDANIINQAGEETARLKGLVGTKV